MAASGRTGGSRGTGSGGRPSGSVRSTSRKGPSTGTGGHNKRRLEGRGPTPPAEQRTGHPKARAAAAAARAAAGGGTRPSPSSRRDDARKASGRPPAVKTANDSELVTGRNAVLEALRAKVPAVELLVAEGVDVEQRLTEALALARKRGLSIAEIPRRSMDRLSAEGVHQGVVLRVPPYEYRHPGDLLTAAEESPEPALIVALDGVTDPHNLGSVARSAAALGGHGVVVPERRAAGVTATAWKASAGALARLPVARATNLARTLKTYADAGLVVVGLAADGELDLDDLELATEPLVLVIGSEGKGLSRLVSDMCTIRVRIPMAGPVESLNAGVATGVALAEIARRRRVAATTEG